MWKKMFRTRQSLEYRKKYKCPICNNYTLHTFNDKVCECENGCDIEMIDVNKLMEENDFNGYYTAQEIRDYFYCDEEMCNEILESIIIDSTPYLIKDNQVKELKSLFKDAVVIDEKLDDLMAKYLNKNKIETNLMFDLGYIVNLIEDIHFFMNVCCNDMVLINYGIKFAANHFYSGRFFYNNAVEHLFQASERIYMILGIIYKYEFQEDLASNKTFKIESYLKKDNKYKNTKIKYIMDNMLKGNKLFSELKDMRCSNDHDLSYYSNIIKEDIDKNGNENFAFWNRDGNDVDKDIYLPKIENLIHSVKEMYKVLNEIILDIDGNTDIYKKKTIPMINKFMDLNKIQITNYKYDSSDLEKLAQKKVDIFGGVLKYRNKNILDIFFRLEEVLHCIYDIFNIGGDFYYKEWEKYGIYQLEELIDEQYLIYSGLIRTYSCYDKIACYIKEEYKYDDIKYFSEFKNILNNDNEIINKIKNILNDSNYELLYVLRNDIFHSLRSGCLYGKSGLEHYNAILFIAIFENLKIQYEFLEFLLKIKFTKIGRNQLCSCGSGKKYKKCCRV